MATTGETSGDNNNNLGLGDKQKDSDKKLRATILNNLGGIHLRLGQSTEAIQCYNQAVALQQQLGDRELAAITLSNIGLIYKNSGDTTRALVCYNEALAIHTQLNNLAGEATILNNIGMALLEVAYSTTINSNNKRAGANGGNGNKNKNKGKANKNKSKATTIKNQPTTQQSDTATYQQALGYLEKALTLYGQIGDKYNEAICLRNIGTLHFQRGNLARAITYMEKCVKIEAQINHPNLAQDAALLERLRAAFHF